MKVNQEIQDGNKELEKVKKVNIKSFRSVNKGVIYNKIVDILLFISEIFLNRMPILVFIKCFLLSPAPSNQWSALFSVNVQYILNVEGYFYNV